MHWCLLLLILTVVVAGCGGGDSKVELVDAIGDRFAQEGPPAVGVDVTPEAADCLAEAFVEAVGYETLVEADLTVEAVAEHDDLMGTFITDQVTASIFYEGMEQCIDLVQVGGELLALNLGISEESALCVAEGVYTNEAVKDAFIESFVTGGEVEDPALTGLMFDLMTDCFTDEELERVLGE